VATGEPAPATPPPTTPEPAKPTMAELQISRIKQWLGSLSDPTKFSQNYAEDTTVFMAGNPMTGHGRADVVKFHSAFTTGFADLKGAPARIWQKGDVAIVEFVLTGTNSGEFMGAKPSNKPMGIRGLSLQWYSPDGLIKQDHVYMDMGTLMSQIGASKMKGRAVEPLPSSIEVHVAKGTPEEDKNVELSKTVIKSFETHDLKTFEAANADDIVWEDISMPAPTKGKAEAKKMFEAMGKAFPDVKIAVDNIWGIEDFVIQETTMTGTHKGPLAGPGGTIPATKKPVNFHGVDVIQIKDGKAVKGWSYANGAELAMQLGLIKPPPAGAANAKPGEKAGEKAGEKPADKAGDKGPAKDAAPAKPPAKK
jgi:steroid delta-isomerase-like uncharacterized protein